jgi:hypothetical protein
MNKLMEERWIWIDSMHQMRQGLLEHLTDADLAFNPGGENPTLGGLFRENGEIEYAYLQSFKTLKQDFTYRNSEAGLDGSVARLKAWLQSLDTDLQATLSAYSDEDLKKQIARPSGNQVPVEMQFDIYLQCMFIFMGKAVVYFRALGKPLPPSVGEYIG